MDQKEKIFQILHFMGNKQLVSAFCITQAHDFEWLSDNITIFFCQNIKIFVSFIERE